MEIHGGEVICKANNDASLGGLVTVFHVERSSGSLENVQNTLPVSPKPSASTTVRPTPANQPADERWLYTCE